VRALSSSAAPGPATGLLAEVVRGPLVESQHVGHLVVLGTDGSLLADIGTGSAEVWARSSLKPLQAVALLRAGLPVDDVGLALACASHSGTEAHLAVVRGTLAAAGMDESALQNTPDLPLDAEASFAWRAAGGTASSLTQNCSGKHAAMLATCRAAGWDTSTYLAPDHPLQQLILETVVELSGAPATHVTVDGCGAPLMSTTVEGLARAFGRIAAAPSVAPGSAEARVALAMTRYPEMVGGPGRDVTAFMHAVPGLVAKDGAEGVYAAGLADGSAVALKVADGSARARAAIMAAAVGALLQAGYGSDDRAAHGRREAVGVLPTSPDDAEQAVAAIGRTPVLGHGRPVGEVVATLTRLPGGVP
jgi:L-asparaginase II